MNPFFQEEGGPASIQDAIAISNTSGTHAARPAATGDNAGALYFETDTQKLFMSRASAWLQIASFVTGPTTPIAHAATHAPDGSDPVSTVSLKDFNSVNQLLQLGASSELPSLNGANLYNLTASTLANLSSGQSSLDGSGNQNVYSIGAPGSFVACWNSSGGTPVGMLQVQNSGFGYWTVFSTAGGADAGRGFNWIAY